MIPRDDQRPNVIDVNCPEGVRGEGELKEGVTGLLPGMLIDLDSTSEDRPSELPIVKKHATSAVAAVLRIAMNDTMHGQGLDDAFDDDEFNFVPFVIPKPGEAFMARVADEFTGSNGALLKSNGDGTFILHGGSGIALAQLDDGDSVDYSVDPPDEDRVLLVRAVAL